MDRLTALEAYVRIADLGTFSAVADELRVRQSTISEWLAALEDELGVQLMERTTRSLRLTDAGETFLADAPEVLAAYAQATGRVLARGDQAESGANRASASRLGSSTRADPGVDRPFSLPSATRGGADRAPSRPPGESIRGARLGEQGARSKPRVEADEKDSHRRSKDERTIVTWLGCIEEGHHRRHRRSTNDQRRAG